MTDRTTEIAARAAAATEGPWRWFGNTSMHSVYLATVNHGRRYVMTFARYGMRGAQPMFRDAPGDDGLMVKASEVARYEVLNGQTLTEAGKEPYRYDICGFDNADAEFISHAREDIPYLLARVVTLETALAKIAESSATDPETRDGTTQYEWARGVARAALSLSAPEPAKEPQRCGTCGATEYDEVQPLDCPECLGIVAPASLPVPATKETR